MPHEEKQNSAWWTILVLALVAMLGWGVSILPGTGAQYRLDVSQGMQSEVSLASMRKASEKLTYSQIEALDWAWKSVDGADFVKRYGVSPTVRQLVLGEVARRIDASREEIAMLEAKLDGMKEQLERNEVQRRKALELRQSYAPVITAIGYSDNDAFGGPARKIGNKKGAVCRPDEGSRIKDEGRGITVRYRLDISKNVGLETLPCRITYSAKTFPGKQEEMSFNCLDRERAPNGDFFVRLEQFRREDPLNVNVSIKVDYEDAELSDPTKCGDDPYAVPALLPELVALKRANKEMKRALGYKSIM